MHWQKESEAVSFISVDIIITHCDRRSFVDLCVCTDVRRVPILRNTAISIAAIGGTKFFF